MVKAPAGAIGSFALRRTKYSVNEVIVISSEARNLAREEYSKCEIPHAPFHWKDENLVYSAKCFDTVGTLNAEKNRLQSICAQLY